MLRFAGVLLGFTLLASLLPADPPDAEVLERFTVHGDGDALIVPVTIQGKNYPFIVDTGATRTVYDTSLRPRMGARTDSESFEAGVISLVLETRMPPEGCVGKLPLPQGKPAPVFDLAPFRTIGGEDVRGILGMDFLGRYVMSINFDAGALTFQKKVQPDAGTALPLYIEDNGAVFVDAKVCDSGPPERFLIDTGVSGEGAGNVEAELFETLVGLGKLEPAGDHLTTTAGHEGRFKRGRLACLSCGPYTLQRAPLSSGKRSHLALGFWSRYHVTFDFPGASVYLRKGKEFDQPFLINHTGLHIHRPGRETVVAVVDPDSASTRAGIKPGDVLIAVGGLPAEQMRLDTLRRQFCQPGKTLSLTLHRDGKKVEASLPLESDPIPSARK